MVQDTEDLYNGGICPVCGEEFVDGFDRMEEQTSYEAKVCVTEVNDKETGHCLIHIDGVQ